MPKLLTKCVSKDYRSAIDNHDLIDRGELSPDDFYSALFETSYAMPHASDPKSPYRPLIRVMLAKDLTPTDFYVSDYQGHFGLEPNDKNDFNVDDIIDLVNGDKTIDEIRANKVASNNKISRGIYIVLGSILLALLYFTAAPFLDW